LTREPKTKNKIKLISKKKKVQKTNSAQ